jgi:hypothetical protein
MLCPVNIKEKDKIRPIMEVYEKTVEGGSNMLGLIY